MFRGPWLVAVLAALYVPWGVLAGGCGEAAVIEVSTEETRSIETSVTPAAPRTATERASAEPTQAPPEESTASGVVCEWATVLEITDGDTIDVVLAGERETVRYIGVDAPESFEALGSEAAAENARLSGQRICLERDLTERDRQGRLLRYAWNESDVLVNEALVRAGLAVVVTYEPDTKYLLDRYVPAEQAARAAGVGLWAAAGGSTPQPVSGGNCEPAYPDFCIPPPSSAGDLDCGDVEGRRFTVLPPDPHGFDRDADGVGCEG
jgi:micrococcal nuclease